MGRKQHQGDKLWLTTQEMKYFFGGKRPDRKTDPDEVDLYGENTKDQRFGTNMLVSGATYTKPLNETSFIKQT